MMGRWARILVLVPALAGFLAATWVADWVAGVAAATSSFAVARMVLELAIRDATARFLAEAESPALDVKELALSARVGLDLGTVIEAKAAVRAAVRRVMVERGAGLAGLCRVPSVVLQAASDEAAAERARVAAADRAVADSEPGLQTAASTDPGKASDAGEHRDAAERVRPE